MHTRRPAHTGRLRPYPTKETHMTSRLTGSALALSALLLFTACGSSADSASQDTQVAETSASASASASASPTPAPKPTSPDQLKTSCTTVVQIGDSTSVGMMSEDFLPDPADRVDAQYKEYGAQTAITDIHGGRSIFETPSGTVSVTDAVEQIKTDLGDEEACWVVAMGTNEVANIAAGSNYTLEQRIDYMMELVGDDPVLWPTVRTIPPAFGYYDNAEMQKMNVALDEAMNRYDNLWVYDWAAQSKDEWFQGDGIHFTTPGNRWRSAIFARAVATAFPAEGEAPETRLFTMDPVMVETE